MTLGNSQDDNESSSAKAPISSSYISPYQRFNQEIYGDNKNNQFFSQVQNGEHDPFWKAREWEADFSELDILLKKLQTEAEEKKSNGSSVGGGGGDILGMAVKILPMVLSFAG